MHKNFGEWYRLVAVEPDGAKLAKRWAGVKAWATALRNDDESVLETVRIFQGLPLKASRDPFLAVFRQQDPAFPQRNDLELQVLAGASLVECVQSVGADGEGLHAAILAGAALEASSLRAKEPRLDEIAREVATGLHVITVEQRKRRSVNCDVIREKADAAVEAMKQIPSISNWDILKSVVTPIFQALVDAVRAADVELTDAAQSLRSADEETNILWWIEGGCSRDTNKPWSALKDGAAVIAGTELADLTDVALGPRNASAFLERVLSESTAKRESALSNYVNVLPDEWAQELGKRADERALDLTPLRLAIFHRGKSDTASWQQYFDSSSGMKSSAQLTAARVARQAYVEAILLRTLADAETEE
ncbi:GTPase-associated system all-helical protein GASH [Sorangium atrum]|uniref:GTPase-associated system all-helical protein GASH n=1 Tax=Sorangium atrum TaxID=2995308 RepID=A0ABT5BZ06_9BACT|nr:GTPase-associated system all-helical protein GASH [Sorangium aterium]MDC0679389.1 GTPase-associated system all-helical protein GASH [Sorangium aterium]